MADLTKTIKRRRIATSRSRFSFSWRGFGKLSCAIAVRPGLKNRICVSCICAFFWSQGPYEQSKRSPWEESWEKNNHRSAVAARLAPTIQQPSSGARERKREQQSRGRQHVRRDSDHRVSRGESKCSVPAFVLKAFSSLSYAVSFIGHYHLILFFPSLF